MSDEYQWIICKCKNNTGEIERCVYCPDLELIITKSVIDDQCKDPTLAYDWKLKLSSYPVIDKLVDEISKTHNNYKPKPKPHDRVEINWNDFWEWYHDSQDEDWENLNKQEKRKIIKKFLREYPYGCF
jgi:hypothetical protein